MSKETWELIKHSKRFYVETYRKACTLLLVSVIFNIVLGFLVHYVYFNRSEPAFYATSGVTPPIQLTPMDEANYTSDPLLASDTEVYSNEKPIPQ